MKRFDYWLQTQRIKQAGHYIRPGSRVLDIGCADGALFKQLSAIVGEGMGIDPDLQKSTMVAGAKLLPGTFPRDLPETPPFDVIVLLAVLEHIRKPAQDALARACLEYLRPGGRLIITVPSRRVDAILTVLSAMRVVDGMHAEQHYGFDPADTESIFTQAGFVLETRRRFQMGLNNLFVFRSSDQQDGSAG